MKLSNYIGIVSLSFLISSQSALAATVTISPTQYVEVSFQLNDPLPNHDIVFVDAGYTSNSIDPLTATLYDGNTLLGSMTAAAPQGDFSEVRQFQFHSSSTQTDWDSTPIDFSSIQDGSIDFRVVFSSLSGSFDIDLSVEMSGVPHIGIGELLNPGSAGNVVYYQMKDITVVEIPTTVPVPAAVWLFGSGLIGLIGFARRKKA